MKQNNAGCGMPLVWLGCYRGTYDLISPESISHPAKMAPALCFKILEHLEELGLLKPGVDTILDPMAGTGMTAIVACAKGYRAVTVELEEKFIGFQKANKEYTGRRLHKELDWQIIQGDARYLSKILSEKGYVGITSPPYAIEKTSGGLNTKLPRTDKDQSGRNPNSPSQQGAHEGYGTTPGQIGNLRDRPITVTSPPYGDAVNSGECGIDWDKAGRPDKAIASPNKHHVGFGVGELRYGHTEGQIGALKDKPVCVTSPPYDNARNTTQEYDDKYDLRRPQGVKWGRGSFRGRYGESDGQIGQEKNGSYLDAMKLVYAEIGKVSHVLACVLKDPTRNGKIRTLGYDTWKLLEQTGWKVVDYHRALLFQEIEGGDLFGSIQKKPKGRISFFKRLSYKRGHPISNYEHIIIAVREGSEDSMTGIGANDALPAECALPTGLNNV